jgi:FMN phosphatase YigB (HAD superfamily)
MPPENFRAELRKYLPSETTDEQIDKAWNAMLLDIPVHRVEWLCKVGEKYRIFLLSNTNTIHVDAFTKMADSVYGKGRV